jgi:hypothetical protein
MASTAEPVFARTQDPPRAEVAGGPDFVGHAYALVVAASFVVVGLIWDISWHMSIGRDTFWTPAHLLIQGGGLIAGATSGALALYITFRGSAEQRRSAVSFWGFRAPFGAWVAVLGCGAMLTSAPFDDWWHDAYGLDVRIVSPPHILLGIGMLGIVLGALVRTLALQNRERSRGAASALFAVSAGLYLTILAIFLSEWSSRRDMHAGSFYRAIAIAVPFVLVAIAFAGRSRWPATPAAAVYSVVMAGTSWVLMLFDATPRLGPIYQHITHYVPLDFPLLLLVPAFALDLTWHRVQHWRLARAALAMGAVFLVTFAAAQWPFADLLMQHGRNWFFHADNFVYWQPHQSERFAFQYRSTSGKPWLFAMHAGMSLLYAFLSSLAGLLWGRWMSQVRR